VAVHKAGCRRCTSEPAAERQVSLLETIIMRVLGASNTAFRIAFTFNLRRFHQATPHYAVWNAFREGGGVTSQAGGVGGGP